MPMVPQPVVVTAHAIERYRERFAGGDSPSARTRLVAALQQGTSMVMPRENYRRLVCKHGSSARFIRDNELVLTVILSAERTTIVTCYPYAHSRFQAWQVAR